MREREQRRVLKNNCFFGIWLCACAAAAVIIELFVLEMMENRGRELAQASVFV